MNSVLTCGGEVGGVRVLSRAGCDRVFDVQADGPDRLIGINIKWGLGFALQNVGIVEIYGPGVASRRITTCGGSGGSTVFNDFDAHDRRVRHEPPFGARRRRSARHRHRSRGL